jgi:hypothetical protein
MVYTQAAGTVQAELTRVAAQTPSATPTLAPTDTAEPTQAPTEAAPTSASQPTEAGAPAATQAPVAVATATRAALPDGAAWQSQTPADGTTYKPGEKFTVTWVVKNTGTTTWSTKYMIRFYAGDQMGGTASKAFPKEVKPNETVELSVDLVAPSNPGKYNGIWALTNADGLNFSPGVSIAISVANGASATPSPATVTPTPTAGGSVPTATAGVPVE